MNPALLSEIINEKKNIKQKKSGIIENEDVAYNFWWTGKNTVIKIANEYLKQG